MDVMPRRPGSGWLPFGDPSREGREAFVVTPFTRLAHVHVAAAAGDVIVAVALAGSLFFSIDPTQARWRVALYLVLTLAPFAVVAPLIGPAIDRARGGSRWVITLTCASRALVAALMLRHLNSLLLFPEAFVMLVMGKGYAVAKSAYVPVTVRGERELVAANARLALLGSIAGPLGAAPAALLHWLVGSTGVVALALVVFAGATVLGMRLPMAAEWSLAASDTAGQSPPSPTAPGAAARPWGRLSGPLIAEGHPLLLAGSTMGLLRGMLGFVTFLLAFDLRTRGGSAMGYGVVLGAAGIGNLVGAAVAPRLRKVMTEHNILVASLATTTVVALLVTVVGGGGAAPLMVGTLGVASASAKLAFDSLVQRDAPSGDKGRALAQFEARFQVLWVVGAFFPVVVPLPARIGYLLLALLGAAAVASYLFGRRSLGSVVSQLARAGEGATATPGMAGSSDRATWADPSVANGGVALDGVTGVEAAEVAEGGFGDGSADLGGSELALGPGAADLPDAADSGR